MRLDGATIAAVRDYLRKHRVQLSYHGAQSLFSSRLLLGELRFGAMVNERAFDRDHRPRDVAALAACLGPARPSREVGASACAARRPALRVVRIAHGGRHVAGEVRPLPLPSRRRLPAAGDDQRRGCRARRRRCGAGTARRHRGARFGRRRRRTRLPTKLERRQEALDAAIRAFAGLEDEAAARERLQELRTARDEARDRHDQLARGLRARDHRQRWRLGLAHA